jgi:hypothetical protein
MTFSDGFRNSDRRQISGSFIRSLVRPGSAADTTRAAMDQIIRITRNARKDR